MLFVVSGDASPSAACRGSIRARFFTSELLSYVIAHVIGKLLGTNCRHGRRSAPRCWARVQCKYIIFYVFVYSSFELTLRRFFLTD